MSIVDVVEQLKGPSNTERLAVIEAATRLIHEALASRSSEAHEGTDRRMREAALALQDVYQPGGELTEWTALDAEPSLDESSPR
jgi:hypothetical protein